MSARIDWRAGRWQALVASLAVVLATVASGSLECSPMLEEPIVAHGHEIYGRMCAVCHGPAGEGYKADQAPALANAGFLSTVTDPFLVAAITSGRTGSTMSSWGTVHGGPLSAADVTAVIAYMRTWQTGDAVALDERPLGGDATRGAALFGTECAQCHGKTGTGGPFISLGNPQLLQTASNGFLRSAIRKGRPGTQMPAFLRTLDDQGIEDVIAHLRALPSGPPPGHSMFAPPAHPPPLPLGPVPLNPHGPDPVGFTATPGFTKADVVKDQLRRGAKMGILDARAPPDYAGEHIAGAVSVPFYDPEPYVASLPKDTWLVCYCGCPHAESGQLAQKLKAKGFTKVTVIDEGLRYWHTKDYGTHTGLLP